MGVTRTGTSSSPRHSGERMRRESVVLRRQQLAREAPVSAGWDFGKAIGREPQLGDISPMTRLSSFARCYRRGPATPRLFGAGRQHALSILPNCRIAPLL